MDEDVRCFSQQQQKEQLNIDVEALDLGAKCSHQSTLSMQQKRILQMLLPNKVSLDFGYRGNIIAEKAARGEIQVQDNKSCSKLINSIIDNVTKCQVLHVGGEKLTCMWGGLMFCPLLESPTFDSTKVF